MEKKKSIWARLTALLLSLSLVAGISAWAIDVPTAEQAVDSDYKTLSTDAPEGFTTNLTGWHAVTGTWEETADGVRGNNKGLDGYYLSDVAYTPGEPFSYEVSFTLNDNSTVAGIIFGVQDPANPVGHFYSLNVDKGRNDSRIFWNGGTSGFWDTSRQLTPAEAALTEMTLRIDYDGTDTLSAYLNDIFVASQSGVVLPGGYFGLNTFYSDVTYHSAMLTEYPEESNFVSNLSDLTYTGGHWTETKDGLRATMSSDAFAIAGENIDGPFVFEGDMTMISGVAMGVIFQAQSENPGATGGY